MNGPLGLTNLMWSVSSLC